MFQRMYTRSKIPVKYVTKAVKVPAGSEGVDDRQNRVPGFNQREIERLKLLLIGGGGIGSEIGEGLLRKGVGKLWICDHDVVEPSNLNRQKFYQKDIFKNKATRLAKNLTKEAIKRTEIIGYPLMFEEVVNNGIEIQPDIAVCGVDSNATRVYVAKYFYVRNTSVIFTAVSEDANHGYVFVQEPHKACFGCLFPESVNNPGSEPCPNTPAIKDILKLVSAFVLYAIDSLIMRRKRNWNYREIFLAGFTPEKNLSIERRKDCPLCKG